MPYVMTTLADLRIHKPCAAGWTKLLTFLEKKRADEEPLSLATILGSNGLYDAVWCLQALPARDNRDVALFAYDFAMSVLARHEAQHPTDTCLQEAIVQAKRLAVWAVEAEAWGEIDVVVASSWVRIIMGAEQMGRDDSTITALFLQHFCSKNTTTQQVNKGDSGHG